MNTKKFLTKIAKKNFVELKIEEQPNGKAKISLSEIGISQLKQLIALLVMIGVSVAVYYVVSRTLHNIQAKHFLPEEKIYTGDEIYSGSFFLAIATFSGLFALLPFIWPALWQEANQIQRKSKSFSLKKFPIVFVIIFIFMFSVSIWFLRAVNEYITITPDYISASKTSFTNNKERYDYNQVEIFRRNDNECFKFVFNKSKEIECVSLPPQEKELVNAIQIAQITKKYRVSEVQRYKYEPKGLAKYGEVTTYAGVFFMFLVFRYLGIFNKRKKRK